MEIEKSVKEKGGGALKKIREEEWKPFDELAGEKGAWREIVRESEKILKPVLKRNKEWRDRSKKAQIKIG